MFLVLAQRTGINLAAPRHNCSLSVKISWHRPNEMYTFAISRMVSERFHRMRAFTLATWSLSIDNFQSWSRITFWRFSTFFELPAPLIHDSGIHPLQFFWLLEIFCKSSEKTWPKRVALFLVSSHNHQIRKSYFTNVLVYQNKYGYTQSVN